MSQEKPSSDESRLIQALVTYRTAWVAGLVALAGGLMLLLANLTWFDTRPVREALLAQIGGLLVGTGIIAMLWDLRGKRDFMREIISKTGVASDVRSSGIQMLTMRWLDVPWESWISGAKEIEVSISYGSSWRKNFWADIRQFSESKSHRLRLYFPNPEDEHTMEVLSRRYDSSPEKVRDGILESAREFAKLAAAQPADVRIYYRDGDPTFTCYRLDDRIVVSLYSHLRDRGPIPVIVVEKGGTFHEFFTNELRAIREQSAEVAPAELSADEGVKS